MSLPSLTTSEIDALGRHVTGFVGCFADSNIPQLARGECCIANLQPSSESGSHWCAARVLANGTACCFDSYGQPADPPLLAACSVAKKAVSSSAMIQGWRSADCGWFCLLFCRDSANWHNAADYEAWLRTWDLSETTAAHERNSERLRRSFR